jgi:hypothetical protein
MKYILKDQFVSYLRQNGCYEEYFEGLTKRLEGKISQENRSRIYLSEVLDLFRVKKFIKVDVSAMRRNVIGGMHAVAYKIESVALLTLDEYIKLKSQEVQDFEAATEEIMKMILK